MVGATVAEYRSYPRIATFAQLRRTPGARADLALSTLGRAYVANCMSTDQRWTAGINLMWWLRERMVQEPEPDLRYDLDLRYELPIAPERQLSLAKGSLLFLRLTFLSDMGLHAAESKQSEEGSPLIQETGLRVQTLESLADDAAEAAGTDLPLLRQWIQDVGLARLDEALPVSHYHAIQKEVHRD